MSHNLRSSSIAPVVTKVHLTDHKKSASFWREQPYLARLEALEQIRQEYNRWKYHAEPGFQRVFTIIKRKSWESEDK